MRVCAGWVEAGAGAGKKELLGARGPDESIVTIIGAGYSKA